MADGFDDNDLRLLARRATAAYEDIRVYNGPLPFEREEALSNLGLLQAAPEPQDAELILEALRHTRRGLRTAYGANLGTEKVPDVDRIDGSMSALVGDLQEILLPFGQPAEAEETEGPSVELEGNEAEIEGLREAERAIRQITDAIVKELSETPIVAVAGAASLAAMVDPLVTAGFIALFLDTRFYEGRLVLRKLTSLLARQEAAISAFEQAVERNRQAVESVTGLYNRAKAAAANVRSKIATVRRGVARIFGQGGETAGTQVPEPRPEGRGERDLPPVGPPTPGLPPPDCTTEDGQPGYLIAGTCYPPYITELRLDREKDIDFAKLYVFHDLWELKITNIPLQDLKVLSGLNSLRSLSLESISASDLNSLSGLTNLSGLSLSDTPINDLTPLQDLVNLQMLSLTKTKVYNLGPIDKLNSLQSLSIEETPVSDLSPISVLFSNLTMLHLKKTLVSNLTPLDGLDFLRWLTVDDMPVKDLTPLAFLERLESLSLAGTMVSDMSPVSGLSSLQSLVLRDTPVSDLTPLQRLENLRHLVLPDGRELGGIRDNEKNHREVQEFLASL